MLFNSFEFIFLFMPVVFVGFFLIAQKSHQGAIAWLGLASIFFYSYWSIAALPIMAASICINYWLSLQISKSGASYRRELLILAILANLLVLGYFKYTNFFIANTNIVRNLIDMDPLDSQNIALPIGISFFTFTQIAFLIDGYQNKVKERSFIQYILFVTFFPHLLAGPVLHHKQMMPQFSDQANFILQKDKIAIGVAIFAVGLAKKVLLADTLGGYTTTFYNSILQGLLPNFWASWIGSIGYAFQIYFDFSGYSDMAVGLGLLFGIWLPYNFNSPFKATSIIDFWQRWHMSLTKYIYEYLYAPITLKLMRAGIGKSLAIEIIYSLVVPTILVMLIVGFWHGANWTFVVFGGMHGIFLVTNHLWRKRRFFVRQKNVKASPLSLLLGWMLTFFCINAAMVMFRSDSVTTAFEIYRGMLGLNGFYLGVFSEWFPVLRLEIAVIAFSFVIVIFAPNSIEIVESSHVCINKYEKWIYPIIFALIGIVYLLYTVTKYQESPFLYFQF